MTGRPDWLWLDDTRTPPPAFGSWARTSREAIALLSAGGVTRVSLDHDLGGPPGANGLQVAVWIATAARSGRLDPLWWGVHSRNAEGARAMLAALREADRAWGDGLLAALRKSL